MHTEDLKSNPKEQSRKLTEGPILKKLMLFALPMMAGNFLQQIYNIADTLIVGRYVGAQALAAVGSAYTLMTFLTSLIIGLCMGSGALFSKWYGAQKPEKMKQDIRLSFYFIGAVTLVLYLFVFAGTDLILQLLLVPDDVYGPMRTYVKIIFIGIGFTFLYNFFAYLLRSVGNSAAPLLFLSVSSVLNIVLDLWFVVTFELQIPGAAAATVISQGVAGIGIFLYTSLKYPEFIRVQGKIQWKRLKAIIRNDVFTGVQQSVMNLGILMIQGLVNSFGTTIMAAFAAAVKIDTLAYMPAQEFGNAYSLFVSQNFGAGQEERIRKGTKLAAVVSVLFCLAVSAVVWMWSEPLMQMFVEAEETGIIAEGVRYLRIEGVFYFGIGCLFLFYGYYRGIQHAEMSLVLTVISLGTRVFLSYLLAPRAMFGVAAIWWSIPIGWILADMIGIMYYRRSICRKN